MRVLLTGSTGFIGSQTKKLLIKEKFTVYEFRSDMIKVNNWVKNLSMNPEAIIHLAGIRTESAKDFTVNVGGVKALSKALVKVSPRPKILIFISSQAVYFGLTPPFSEDMKPHPPTIYGRSKLEAEQILLKIGLKFGVRTVILRPSTVLGSGVREKSRMSGPLFAWSRNALNNLPLEVFQDGNQARDYLAVTDLAQAIILALNNRQMEGVFNVSGDKKIRLSELANWIKNATKSQSKIVIKGGLATVNDPRELFSSSAKIRKFGWKAKKSIRELILSDMFCK